MFNKQQVQVINHMNGPAAVLAGAGSGKTATLIGRIEKLANIVDPKRIVMITFTNAAADEMKLRATRVNDKCKNILATTYHKYCGMMLRRYGKVIGLDSSFEILELKTYKLLIDYVKGLDAKYENLENFPSVTRLDTIFSKIINTDDTIETCIADTNYSMYGQEIKELFDAVKKYGLDNQKLNFDDMLVYMNKLLDIDEICEKIAMSFDYLMVDEFQDTNTLQLDMLYKLSQYNKNIIIVGDISQSIYKFRGAKVTNIQNFIDYFDDCIVYTLNTNYRSTQEILDATNDMMVKNVYSWPYTNMVSNDKHGTKPIIIHHDNDFTQADWVISKITDLVDEGYDLSQIAIIERKSMSSFKLENELVKAEIPFEKRGGKKFTEYSCVGELLSFLSIIVKANDKFNWFNVLKLLPGIGPTNASDISSHCNIPNFENLYKKRKYYLDLVELCKNVRDYKKYENDLKTLFNYVENYYLSLRLAKIEKSTMKSNARFDAKERLKNDKKILEILKDMASHYDNTTEFLEDIALDTLKSNTEYDDRLLITTIHSAKGLEWPVTILLDCIERENDDEEEELRCLYVAMTRAEDNLIISIPTVSSYSSYDKYGRPNRNELIHFLQDSLEYFEEGYA